MSATDERTAACPMCGANVDGAVCPACGETMSYVPPPPSQLVMGFVPMALMMLGGFALLFPLVVAIVHYFYFRFQLDAFLHPDRGV